jgi:hypothetical protein
MKDGYPEQEDIDFLKNLSIDNFKTDIYKIVDLFSQSGYGNAVIRYYNYASKLLEQTPPETQMTMPILIISTGGWSGCEDMIAALIENIVWWHVYWAMSERGGRYTFCKVCSALSSPFP